MNTITRKFARQRGLAERCSLIYAVLSGLLLLGISGQAYSACEPTIVLADPQIVTAAAQSIPAPLAAGVRIGTFTASNLYYNVFQTSCGGTQSASTWGRAKVSAVSTWNGYSVYPTGVAGIGYAVELADPNGSYTKLTTNETGGGNRFFSGTYIGTLGIRSRVYFVTTAPLASGVYDIPTQFIALTRSRNLSATSIDGSPGASSNMRLNTFRLTVGNTTCDLAAGDVSRTITLDTIKRADFVGQWAGLKIFEITANCTAVSRVTFSFSGTPAPGDGWRYANTGTATGIGLWLYSLIGGVRETITPNTGNYQRTVNVVSGKAVLPGGMGYFKTTGNPITSGTLVSTVTVNITYQ
ncbi:fimbrial protein [Pseudomonas sp. McL0111]|uniref:fimbrial protein n=1 Tax=Pseudomonas sp. McL0111 TaxID=3457357 RepID=UPI00403E39C8